MEFNQQEKEAWIEKIMDLYQSEGLIELAELVIPSREELAWMTPEERAFEMEAFMNGYYSPEHLSHHLRNSLSGLSIRQLKDVYQAIQRQATLPDLQVWDNPNPTQPRERSRAKLTLIK